MRAGGLVEGSLLGNLHETVRGRRHLDGRGPQAAAAGTFGREVMGGASLLVLKQAHGRAAVHARQVVVARAPSVALGSGRLAAGPQRHLPLLIADRRRGFRESVPGWKAATPWPAIAPRGNISVMVSMARAWHTRFKAGSTTG